MDKWYTNTQYTALTYVHSHLRIHTYIHTYRYGSLKTLPIPSLPRHFGRCCVLCYPTPQLARPHTHIQSQAANPTNPTNSARQKATRISKRNHHSRPQAARHTHTHTHTHRQAGSQSDGQMNDKQASQRTPDTTDRKTAPDSNTGPLHTQCDGLWWHGIRLHVQCAVDDLSVMCVCVCVCVCVCDGCVG